MNAIGHRIGKITHLDPIGLCFGRLFSEPRFRLSPSDALDTQAVHVSLNLFDNPLDGSLSNFLVNGGRDQIGCGGQSELKNSTTSSVSLLFDSQGSFTPCSHMRALSLFEDDLSSEPDKCQIVGYRCTDYNRFLAGKCGKCNQANDQCRLMSLSPISLRFRRLTLNLAGVNENENENNNRRADSGAQIGGEKNSSQIQATTNQMGHKQRIERRLSVDHKGRFVQTIDKLKSDTRNALAEGWSGFKSGESRFKVSSLVLSKLPPPSSTAPNLSQNLSAPILSISPTTIEIGQPSLMAHEALEPEGFEEAPVGSQALPAGSANGPQYFVGTGAISPYCVNYYQVRVLIAESRLQRSLVGKGLAPNRLAVQANFRPRLGENELQLEGDRRAMVSSRNMLHLTIKLTDSKGHFFKGFSMLEDARNLVRIQAADNRPRALAAGSDQAVELTMLLNSTQPEPVRVSESIISYYFHGIVLADSVEINYMSNISPE